MPTKSVEKEKGSLSATRGTKPALSSANARVPNPSFFPNAEPIRATQGEIPPGPESANLDAILARINALRSVSTASNTSGSALGFVESLWEKPAGATTTPIFRSPESVTSTIPGKDKSRSRDFIPTAIPSAGEASRTMVSKVVQELQSISKQKEDTFESRIADKPKTLIDEYGDTKIYRVQGEPLLYYWVPVARPTVSERAIINTLKEAATRLISITPYRIRDPEQKRNVYAQQVLEILRASPELKVPSTKYDFYATAVVSEMVGYGLIDTLIKDDRLEEVMVIGPRVPVYVFHRKYDMMISNVEFTSDGEIEDVINRIAREIGRRVDISSPLLDARLPDGSRVNATIPPASVSGSTLTVRKFRLDA